ncbi:ATP-binding protein [Microbispora sp. H10670]|uniref:ATP-binding protein n=1 Tax=Microbispora sp. H10670 TaxID=2729108 RepID=UPI001600BE72|nr:tetratricopeptide repeat protein [Microbispora sp. H10670]
MREETSGGDSGTARLELRIALRRLRRERGLSQRDLVRPLHLASHSAIADYESGRRLPPADILAAYERHFGLTPGRLKELRDRALVERAAAEARTARKPGPGEDGRSFRPVAVPRQLPAGTTLFTGRAGELAALDSLPDGAPAGTVIAVVTGMAGVGKTSLAVQWAHRARDRFPDGDLYVDLRGHHPTGAPLDPGDVLDMFLGALGVTRDRIPPTPDERAALYRTLLAGRAVLVVLDNARDVEQVRPLLPGAGPCAVLVTSRSRMAGLVAREGAVRIALDVLDAHESAELLRHAIGSDRADAEPLAVADLARHCAYHPLALRVVAERAGSRPAPLAETVAELADRRGRLDVLAPHDDEATAVRTVFRWSYEALSSPARELFRLLGLHDGPDVGVPAAAALADVTAGEGARLLGELAATHLLTEHAPGRYRLHDLLRLYAGERVLAEEDRAARTAAVRRFAGWYLHSACAARVAVSPGLPAMRPEPVELAVPATSFSGHAEALAWCEAELPNLVAATEAAEEAGLHRIAWQLPTALYGFFDLRKRYAEWIGTHEIALRCAREAGDREAEGRILCNLGNAHLPAHRPDEALSAYQESLAIFREVGYRQGEAKALGNFGATYDALGRWGEAAEAHERSLVIFREIGDPYGEALTLSNIGDLRHRQSRPAEAAELHRRALAISRAIPDPHGEARALGNLCTVAARLGKPEEALQHGTGALELFRALGDRYQEALLLACLGEVHDALADPGRAEECLRQASALFHEIGDDRQEARVLDLLASRQPPHTRKPRE